MKNKISFVMVMLFLLAVAAGEIQAAAVDFSTLDVAQGFNFNAGVQTPVGYITSLTIGGTAVNADMLLRDPNQQRIPVVGVLKSINWGGGTSDAISYEVQISTYNKQQIASLLQPGLSDTSVQFNFMVYDYDPIAQAYFYSFGPSSSQPVKGFIARDGTSRLLISLGPKGSEVLSPENWGLQITAMPDASYCSQELLYYVGVGAFVVKQWGFDQMGCLPTSTNTSPVLAHNTGLTVNQTSGQTTITTAMLRATDVEQAPASLTYTVGTAPTKGTLKRNAATLAASATFTQADIDANIISYTPLGTKSGADSFTFAVSDGAGGYIGTTTFPITINDNVAPTASISYSPAGPYKKGDTVTIWVHFSETMAYNPAAQIAVSAVTGGSALPATNLTQGSATLYSYSYLVGSGNGTAYVTLAGNDLAGHPVDPVPISGASFIINKTTSATTLQSSTLSPTYGNQVTFTAGVNSGATGTVDFKDGPTALPGCTGVAVNGASRAICTTTALASGSHSIRATYNGDNTYTASTSGTTVVTVGKATLSIAADPKTKVYGAPDPELTYGYLGLANGDSPSIITGVLARDSGNSLGTYPITVNTLAAGSNYTIAFTGANLNIVTGGVNGVVVDPDNPQHRIAGLFGAGIQTSTNGGATWTGATTQPDNPGIRALVMLPTDHGTLYAASYGSGIFKSVDSGDHWTPCANDGLGSLNATSLAIDPGGKLYAGTEAGIFASADCTTWQSTGASLPALAGTPPVAIAIDPAAPGNLYAGLDGAGIYKSTDSGGSWTAASSQPTNQRIKAVVIKPGDGTRLFAATYGGGVYKSENSGADWSDCANTGLTNINMVSLTIDAGGKLYAGTEGGVFISNDGCGTWTRINGGLP